MTDWLHFLVAQGGQVQDRIVTSFGETPGDYPHLAQATVLADLGSQGILGVEGPGGAKFLQGQTTCDINALTETTAITGAICNPKGRMITSFRAIAAGSERVLLAMHRELVQITLQAVGKYAVFFKAKLLDRTPDYRQVGIAGPGARTLLAKYFPTLPVANGQVSRHDDTLLLRLADDRFLLLVPLASAIGRWRDLAAEARPVGLPFWQLLDIRAGEGQVVPQTSEEFIPQMLNFDVIGAISFKKGCYTGQEVVARMQYLGKLKRHMYRLMLADATLPPPGTEIFPPDQSQSAGTLVSAAPADTNCCEALVVLKDGARDAPRLRFAEKLVSVQLATLPYSENDA